MENASEVKFLQIAPKTIDDFVEFRDLPESVTQAEFDNLLDKFAKLGKTGEEADGVLEKILSIPVVCKGKNGKEFSSEKELLESALIDLKIKKKIIQKNIKEIRLYLQNDDIVEDELKKWSTKLNSETIDLSEVEVNIEEVNKMLKNAELKDNVKTESKALHKDADDLYKQLEELNIEEEKELKANPSDQNNIKHNFKLKKDEIRAEIKRNQKKLKELSMANVKDTKKAKKEKEMNFFLIDEEFGTYYVPTAYSMRCFKVPDEFKDASEEDKIANLKPHEWFPECLINKFRIDNDRTEFSKHRLVTKEQAKEINVARISTLDHKGFSLYKEGDLYTGNQHLDVAWQYVKGNLDGLKMSFESLYVLDKVNDIWTYKEGDVKSLIRYDLTTINNVTQKDCDCVRDQIPVVASREVRDDEFINKLDDYTGKLFFKNGVLDISDGSFQLYSECKEKFLITRKMSYNYEKDENNKFLKEKQDILDKVIYPIFNINRKDDGNVDKTTTEYLTMLEVISYLFNRVAGNKKDKYWLVQIGERNSGKGVIEISFDDTFGKNVGSCSGHSFILKDKASLESAEREFGFARPYVESNLVFQSEIPSNRILDGVIIKKLTSGGDKIQYRQAYETLAEGRVRAGSVFNLNDFKGVSDKDALETMLYFNMPSYFGNEPDPNKLGTFRKADDSVKSLFKTENYKNAYVNLLLDLYTPSKYPILKKAASVYKSDNEEEGPIDFLKTHFGFDNEELGTTCDEIKQYLTNHGVTMSSNKLKPYIVKLGGVESKHLGSSKTKRGYKNMYIKSNYETEE